MTRTRKESQTSVVIPPRRELCLDFANTLAWRGSEPTESLQNLTDLHAWCDSNGLPSDGFHLVDRWSRRHREWAVATFRQAIEVRETIYRLFYRIADGRAPENRDIGELNAALELAPARRILAHADQGLGWRLEHDGRSAAALLAPVLWSAADLLVGPDTARVRHCSNHKCLWLFFDDSKNRSRRWCSMQACGNRAKAHRHYLKRRAP
jgi:predicted RNA-binding Zn ribbon-like protein